MEVRKGLIKLQKDLQEDDVAKVFKNYALERKLRVPEFLKHVKVIAHRQGLQGVMAGPNLPIASGSSSKSSKGADKGREKPRSNDSNSTRSLHAHHDSDKEIEERVKAENKKKVSKFLHLLAAQEKH